MDAGQFKQFMNALLVQQQTLVETITSLVKGKEENITQILPSFSSLVPFENYDSKKEKFLCYLERFENYCSMKNIKEEDKMAQLLCVSIGSFQYNNLASFLGPDSPVNKLSYTDLVNSFKQMLAPKKNLVVAQHYFLNTYQKENQSISEYVADLQRDIRDCEFTTKCECDKTISIADTFLRAQFIRGVRDNWLREQILQANLTKFEDILAKAVALEASKIESRQLTQCRSNQSHSFDVDFDEGSTNKVSSNSRYISTARSSSRHRERSSSQGSFSKHSKSSGKLGYSDFKTLGMENRCIRCGRDNHKVADCRVDWKQLYCESCKKKGHVSKVCIKSLLKSKNVKHITSNDEYSNKECSYEINNVETPIQQYEIVDLFKMNSDSDRYLINVYLNGKMQNFEVDSGVKYSLLSDYDFKLLDLKIPLENSSIVFRSYSGNIIKPLGRVQVKIKYHSKEIVGDLHIVPNGHEALLGREWIRALQIELHQIDNEMFSTKSVSQISTKTSTEDVISIFSNIFEERIGCVPNFQVSLQLREGSKPVFTREREVPYALRERVNKELDTLEANGIISPVAVSDWGSPLVIIPKADGGVRLCVDYKCGVNERLVKSNYPIRRIDDVLHSLRNSSYYCKLDLFKAYLHLKVDEQSSFIQTISTHRGTYRMNRLSFGVKTAPSEFNRIISQILQGLNKTEAYFDDIIVHGATLTECKENLQACLQRLQDYDLHLNKNKCIFFTNKVEYLGHIIEYNKISKSPIKIQVIKDMSRPSNVEELRRFLGLITYYSKFIPDFSTVSYPLRQLLQKNTRWKWTVSSESAFSKLKSELCNDNVLFPFDPSLPVVLTTDASPTGLGAILSHQVNGHERPIAYASRSLSNSEMNYSQLDREALAIIFGVTHFYNYLFGKHFMLVTDNEPLSRILHPHKALPKMTSARLLRYASFLSGFDYTLKCKKGEENQNVDCLSRATVHNPGVVKDIIGEEANEICAQSIFSISSSTITSLTIKKETEKDSELSKVVSNLLKNSEESEFTLLDGILFWKDRVVVPKALRSTVLNELHETHLGITKMKQLARRYVYWPGIDKDIERLVRECENCALIKSNPAEAPVHSWETPQNNWDRIHVDYAGPLQNHNFLICVDAKSKWVEVRTIREAPTSSSTIVLLQNIFSMHGYPKVLVSDNATLFTSEEFTSFCKTSGIFQKFIAPGHPATNGLAERNVQTLKHKILASSSEDKSIQNIVQEILFRYRATPLICGKTPAELYLQRKLRIRLDAIFPYKPEKSDANVPVGEKTVRKLQLGERVQVRFFENNKNIWKFGEVLKVFGNRHYLIKLDNGRIIKRHINQLRYTLVPKKRVTFGPNQYFNVPRLPQPPAPAAPHNEHVPEVLPTADNVIPSGPQDQPNRPQRERRPPKWLQDYAK